MDSEVCTTQALFILSKPLSLPFVLASAPRRERGCGASVQVSVVLKDSLFTASCLLFMDTHCVALHIAHVDVGYVFRARLAHVEHRALYEHCNQLWRCC